MTAVIPRLVVAGATSGVGKTTITTAILGALVQRGLRVAPFKAGPDYIDPSYHARAAGVPSRNLDTWMLAPEAIHELFARATRHADLALIEGVMGLFDGRESAAGMLAGGSTAELAALIGAPVLVVLDVGAAAQSAGALALGYLSYARTFGTAGPRVAGFILNQVASPGHYRLAADAIRQATGLPVVGYFPKNPALAVPERHLGLIPATERALADNFLDQLRRQAAATLDLDAVIRIANSALPLPEQSPALFPEVAQPLTTRIAVAQDEAFGFYYQDALDLLTAWGAELVPFSPLRDPALPRASDIVYLGGGFPEVYAAELAANTPMLASLRAAAGCGRPIYGECGGLMYLGAGLIDLSGQRHSLVGLAPYWSTMRNRRLSLGYATVTAQRDGPLLRRGETGRGHEFHWSEIAEPADVIGSADQDTVRLISESSGGVDAGTAAYEIAETSGRLEGYQRGSVLASYVHLHFGSDRRLAPRLVRAGGGADGQRPAS